MSTEMSQPTRRNAGLATALVLLWTWISLCQSSDQFLIYGDALSSKVLDSSFGCRYIYIKRVDESEKPMFKMAMMMMMMMMMASSSTRSVSYFSTDFVLTGQFAVQALCGPNGGLRLISSEPFSSEGELR